MDKGKRLEAIQKMLESLIKEDTETANSHFSEYVTAKTRSLILGDVEAETDDGEAVVEQSKEAAFSNSGTVMDDDVKGDIKFKNGGKKTLKKHGNSSKELDDNIKGNIKFKNGGKQPAKVLEPTPKPAHFDDGRKMKLGTTD